MTLSRLAIRWEEQICVPSEMLQYLNVIANPASNATGK
jgi:hypothetical protein